ncbi:MAG: hypothetical protein J5858_01605 [Lentisphaeria bacterium]|nr:hypothetical protein [Lentisphaeria bacterium]
MKEDKNEKMNSGNPTQHAIPSDISLNAVLEIAKAAQQIRNLRELREKTVELNGHPVFVRRSLQNLARECCSPRRIIALMLHAADNPDWAWCNFWAAFCPEMTMKQMAALRKINVSTVKYHLSRTQLPADAYEFIPENH